MKQISQNLPLKLHHKGFYYGYLVLIVGTLGVVMSVPGQTMGVSVYTDHLIGALGVNRVNLSMMYMFGTLSSAFILPFAGRLLDQLGARFLGVLACAGLALSLTSLSLSPLIVSKLTQVSGIESRYIALFTCYLCFLGIRHFGQGQLTMASRTMMGRWFEKKRGLMLGLSGTFVAFGFGGAPVFLTGLIAHFEWQRSLIVLSLMALAMALVALFFFRSSPESCGLAVDGGLLIEDESNSSINNLSYDLAITAKEAKSTLTFWIFNLGMVAQALLVTALTFHLGDIGRLAEMDAVKVFSVFLPVSVIATVTELLSGHLSDRISMKYLLSIMQCGLCLGLFGLNHIEHSYGFWSMATGLGISGGMFSLLMSAAWPKLFGRTHLGSIMGVTTAWMVGGSAVGPYLYSVGKSLSGTYHQVIYLSMLFPLLILVLSFFANPPAKVNRR